MNLANIEFKEKGFIPFREVWHQTQIEKTYKLIIDNIKKCTEQLGCGVEDYLKVISRWTHPSIITNPIYLQIESDVKKLLRNITQKELILVELDVIRKSSNANRATPCHQDISYTPENPYDFSVWMPLQDVSKEDGVLEVLPGSHLNKIEPAVDYWKPDFVDKIHLSSIWQNNFSAFPIAAGDCILFDSRIWHRSDANRTGRDRFVIVSRWRVLGEKTTYHIPERIFSEFGIWNCGAVTKSLLHQGLEKGFKLTVTGDLTIHVNKWLEILQKNENLPFLINIQQAQHALKDLLILHKASELHNGGDMQGIIYPAVWEHLLQPLSKWLKND